MPTSESAGVEHAEVEMEERPTLFERPYDDDDDDEEIEQPGDGEKKKNCCGGDNDDKISHNYAITKGDAKRNSEMVKQHPSQGKYFGTVDSIGKRSCTDILMLILLICSWIAMTIVGKQALDRGDPYRLLGPINSMGQVCGYEEGTYDTPNFYTVMESGLGSCVRDCFDYDADPTSTDPDDYVCLSIPFVPVDKTLLQSYISLACMDSNNVYDSSTNCGCNLIRKTDDVFRRCRFSNQTIADHYITQVICQFSFMVLLFFW